MAYENIIYDRPEIGVCRITMNRPEVLNALSVRLIDEIYLAAEEAALDPSVSVLVYRGAGRAFSAGRDFKERGQVRAESGEDLLDSWRGFGPQTWLHAKATVAEVRGYALGGGGILATCCDVTIASRDAKFGFPELRHGGLLKRMVWNYLISPKKVKEYVLTGRLMSAEEAYDIGLVNQLVDDVDLEATVLSVARDIAAIERRNPGHIAANKWAINQEHAALAAALEPRNEEAKSVERSYITHVIRARESFDADINSVGIRRTLEAMHEGFSPEGSN